MALHELDVMKFKVMQKVHSMGRGFQMASKMDENKTSEKASRNEDR